MAACDRTLFTLLATFLGLISGSSAIRCGIYSCPDSNTCCGDQCCRDLWDVWWFWSIWVFIFLMMLACAFCCRQQRAARARRQQLLVVQTPVSHTHPYTQGYNQGYVVQGYGTIGNSDCAPIVYAPSPTVSGTAPPGYAFPGAQQPPAYTPAAKPPGYTPVPQST